LIDAKSPCVHLTLGGVAARTERKSRARSSAITAGNSGVFANLFSPRAVLQFPCTVQLSARWIFPGEKATRPKWLRFIAIGEPL